MQSTVNLRRRRIGLVVAGVLATLSNAQANDTSALPDNLVVQTVNVNGERERDERGARGALGDRADLDTPFATASVGSAQIEDRQIASLAQVFADDASVTSQGGTYTQAAHAVNVRGLRLDFTNGYKIDGQPFQMFGVELPLETVESVQLLKGASGFLYGFAAPGGIINYITKKPTNETLLSVDAGWSSASLKRAHVDAGGRFGDDKRFGYRANLAREQGGTYNGAEVNRQAASVALDARLTKDLAWSANFLYQERDIDGAVPTISLQNYPAGTRLPSPVDGRKDFGAYATSYYNSTLWMGTTALDWRINRDWKASLTYGHTVKRIDSANETLYLTNAAGNYSNRLAPFYRPNLTYDAVQASAEGKFFTGPLRHHVTFGAGWQTLERTLNPESNLSLFGPATAGNLYAPPPVLVDTSTFDRSVFYTISEYTHKSVFASDTIEFNDNWSVLAGARYVDYENLNWNARGVQTSSYNKKPVSPTVALLYKPSSNATFYTSYVEALEDGGTVGTTYANANEVLPPLTSRQAELGVKVDQVGWAANAALFRVKRGATYADYSTDPRGVFTQAGELGYKGLEINGSADVTRWLKANGGVTWLDAEYKATAPALIGNRVESTPRFQAVLGLEAKVPQLAGLSLHANASYLGEQEANSANTIQVPSLTLFNLGGAWRTRLDNRDLTLRLQVNNVAGKDYWYSAGSNSLQIGAPRTISFNARIDL
ncbi:TonB-dependent receptor [Massilia aurea]|uniref:TonB-dependent siderophore receptor n=1 Tax=Massilia aurea TaxID=373040 RepID=UPI0034630D54